MPPLHGFGEPGRTGAGARARDAIRAKALASGFDAVGFAPAELGPEARDRLGAFLAAGHHGDMGWLADRADQRAHPRALWAEARSVVALGLSYAPEGDPLATLARPSHPGGGRPSVDNPPAAVAPDREREGEGTE